MWNGMDWNRMEIIWLCTFKITVGIAKVTNLVAIHNNYVHGAWLQQN